jgi:hypothetical protein
MIKNKGAWDPLQTYKIRSDGDEAQAYSLLTCSIVILLYTKFEYYQIVFF